ncbi:MAG: 3-hydroxyanthranilate 3,4-dioxygenase [Oligoflexales bacterium]|nr:3-hydroxyanthranilate 3,4-dioxygenase [Oligoflexales bacterium]
MLPPINFKKWIDEHRDQLKPPVCNQVVYKDADFIIMVVGGPNSRKDYHLNETEEFFYQLEGDMLLKIKDKEGFKDILIKQGEIFLLPASTPHSPQRFANTVGLVIERRRPEASLDAFQWYCDQCTALLYEERVKLTNIVQQLPPIFQRYQSSGKHTCQSCGFVNAQN